MPSLPPAKGSHSGLLCSWAGWAQSCRAGSSLAPWEGPTCPLAPQCWVLQRGCHRGGPVQSSGRCGEVEGPNWREKRGLYPEKGGCGLTGLGDGEAWLSPSLHLGSASAQNPRGAGFPALRPSFRPQEAIWELLHWEGQPAGPLQLPHSGTRAGTKTPGDRSSRYCSL